MDAVSIPPAGRSHRVIAWWGFGAAAFYAVFVRFFEATGASFTDAGVLLPQHQPGGRMASYLAGLLILLGGVACLYLALPAVRVIPFTGGREIPRVVLVPLCLAPVVVGAVFAVGHALTGMITKSLALAGVIEIPYPDVWQSLDETASAWWDLLFYEPWFLVMGVLLHLAALRYLRDRAHPVMVRATAIGSATGAAAVAGVMTTMILTDTVLVL